MSVPTGIRSHELTRSAKLSRGASGANQGFMICICVIEGMALRAYLKPGLGLLAPARLAPRPGGRDAAVRLHPHAVEGSGAWTREDAQVLDFTVFHATT